MSKRKSTPEPAGESTPEPKPETGKSTASVFAPDGKLIRTYSKEVHGENFLELAKGFARKVAGRKVEE